MNDNKKAKPQERQAKILEILSKENGDISQKELLIELNKYPKYSVKQSDISKDFKKLNIKRRKNRTGYDISTNEKKNLDITELKKIADASDIKKANVIPDVKILIIRNGNIGHSYILAKHLIQMYNIIIDTVCLENNIIIYYKDIPLSDGSSFADEIIKHLP